MLLPGNTIMQAVCRTLLHSLWQGLIIAVLAGAVVLFTKRLRPAARYTIFTGLLLAFVLMVGATFYHQLQVAATAGIASLPAVQQPAINNAIPAGAAIVTDVAVKPQGLAYKLFAYFNAHANSIVFGWLLIMAFRCLQMLIGLRGVYILKNKGVETAGAYWTRRLTQLAQSINVKGNITLLQSAIAKVPMVIGHFKPVILIPAGILTALPQDEIEAILLHELAHIRRKDYLVNLLQNFCEILFFFNPAVLWLSSLIKDERENCCDDIALHEVKNKKQFIHALISFQEYNLAASKYAPGFPGQKDHLLNRVKRIITNNNKTLSNMEKTLLATGIVLLSFATITFAQTNKSTPKDKQATHTTAWQNNKVTHVTAWQNNDDALTVKAGMQTLVDTAEAAQLVVNDGDAVLYNDTTPARHRDDGNGSHYSINTDFEGKRIEVTYEDDKITSLYIDGKQIPADKIADYKDLTDRLLSKMKEQQAKFAIQQQAFAVQQQQFQRQQELFRQQQEKFTEQRQAMARQRDSLGQNFIKQQQDLNRVQEQLYKEQQRLYMQQREEYRKLQDKYRHTRDSLGLHDGDGFAPMPPMEPMTPMEPANLAVAALAPMPPMEPGVSPMPAMPGEPAIAPTPRWDLRAPMAPPMPPMPAVAVPNKTVVAIISYLQDNNVDIDDENVSFKLDDKELVVNGKKQPDNLFNALKQRYIKNTGDHVTYTTHKTSTGRSTHTDITVK